MLDKKEPDNICFDLNHIHVGSVENLQFQIDRIEKNCSHDGES